MKICPQVFTSRELQLNRSFQFVERNRTAAKCAKVKSLVRFFLLLSNMQICEVLATVFVVVA